MLSFEIDKTLTFFSKKNILYAQGINLKNSSEVSVSHSTLYLSYLYLFPLKIDLETKGFFSAGNFKELLLQLNSFR